MPETDVLDGRAVADALEADLIREFAQRREHGRSHALAVLAFGDEAPSRIYRHVLAKACAQAGVKFAAQALPAATTLEEAHAAVSRLNRDPAVTGIMIQRPLPPPLADESILQAIHPRKDVDGVTFENAGRLLCADGRALLPCTPAAVLELLNRSGHSPEGRHVVVLGRSPTAGRPLANLLALKEPGRNATVTLCHSGTHRLEDHTRRADIVVSAVGRPGFVDRRLVADHSVVIDVGTNWIADATAKGGHRMVGDCDFDALRGHVRALSPVPGGVGPITVAMVLRNLLQAGEG